MDESLRPYTYATAAGVTVLVAIGIWGYLALPPHVPTTFDFSGRPAAWGPSWTVLLMPLAGVLTAAIL